MIANRALARLSMTMHATDREAGYGLPDPQARVASRINTRRMALTAASHPRVPRTASAVICPAPEGTGGNGGRLLLKTRNHC